MQDIFAVVILHAHIRINPQNFYIRDIRNPKINMVKNMKGIVLGGAGTVGSWTVRALARA